MNDNIFLHFNNRIDVVDDSGSAPFACMGGCTAIVDTTVSMILMPPLEFHQTFWQYIYLASKMGDNIVSSVLYLLSLSK